VKILASLTIRAVAILMVLFAWFCLILVVDDSLVFKLVSAMGKTALVTKLARLSEFPIMTGLQMYLHSKSIHHPGSSKSQNKLHIHLLPLLQVTKAQLVLALKLSVTKRPL